MPLSLFAVVPEINSLIGDFYSFKEIKNRIEYKEKLSEYKIANLSEEAESYPKSEQYEREVDHINKILLIDAWDERAYPEKGAASIH